MKSLRLFLIFPLLALIPANDIAVKGTDKRDAKPKASEKMRELVCDISMYVRNSNPNFIIIPQNGAELAFNNLDPGAKTHVAYMDAIDGIAVEDLFFDGKLKTDTYRLKMLRDLKKQKPVLFSDYITKNALVDKVAKMSQSENFLFFPRTKNNEHYHIIPENVTAENSDDIVKLSDVKNYLYLTNASAYSSKKQYLDAVDNTNYDLVIIDLYYNSVELTTRDLAPLKTKANGGKRLVLSYLNIGAAENWRYYWNKDWKINNPSWIKKKYAGYEDEFYVQYWHPEWRKIITGNKQSYVQKILNAGFDGAFLDNVEAYYALYNK